MATVPLTAVMAKDQENARKAGWAQQERANHGETLLEVQDSVGTTTEVIHIYNILDREHHVHQPPLFPDVMIPACPRGQRFSFTLLPRFVKETYLKPGSTEFMYKVVDGRKAASSLLNPAAFPGTRWEAQLFVPNARQMQMSDQEGNNLNRYGCWWSLTRPDETEKLNGEIKQFTNRVLLTMNEMIAAAEICAAQGDLKSISPMMHFAMDYLGKSAPWHMTHQHKVACPVCGDQINEGIAYHRNSFGDKCIIDTERYLAMMALQNPAPVKPAPVAAAADEEEDDDNETLEVPEEKEEEGEVPAKPAPKKAPKKKT